MLVFHALLTCFMATVIVYDISKFVIPNWLVLILLLLYPAMVLMVDVPVAWLPALAVAGIAFAVGFFFFVMRWVGGGDVKLLAVCFLWAGKDAGVEMLFYTAVLGGVLSVVLWLVRPVVAWSFSKLPNPPVIPRVLTIGEPAPYGVAIAIAFIILVWMGLIPGLPIR